MVEFHTGAAPDDAFYACPNATADAGVAAKQSVWIRGSDVDPATTAGFAGTYALSFAGSTTAALSVFATASDVETALAALDTVRGDVEVFGLLAGGAVTNATESGRCTQIRFGVRFSAAVDTVEEPQNLGAVPLLAASTESIDGNATAVAAEVCAGAYADGYDYAEQVVTLAGDRSTLDGAFTLTLVGSGDCGNGTSAALAASADALDLITALGDVGPGLFGDALAPGRVDAILASEGDESISWTVRFYTLPGEALTGCSDDGAFPALVAGGSLADRVAVAVAAAGAVPPAAMPVDVTLQVSMDGSASAAEAEADQAYAAVAPLVVVCGDGAYVSAEGCDDGNVADGDGCGRNCTVEAGFVCTRPISYTSVCSVPLEATIQFADASTVALPEGNATLVVVARVGDNATACDVAFTTLDSTAKHRARENTEYSAGRTPAAGDYVKANGTLSFAAGETAKTVALATLADGTYDGPANEVFALRLTSTTCAGGFANGESQPTKYVQIVDGDVAPSAAPTGVPPSAAPTPQPSIGCDAGEALLRFKASGAAAFAVEEDGETVVADDVDAYDGYQRWLCLADGCYAVVATAAGDWRVDDAFGGALEASGDATVDACVAGGALEAFPTAAPTLSAAPTLAPSASAAPTAAPTTAGPSAPPTSAAPSAPPTSARPSTATAAPAAAPTAAPVAPTAEPAAAPTAAPVAPTAEPAAAPTAPAAAAHAVVGELAFDGISLEDAQDQEDVFLAVVADVFGVDESTVSLTFAAAARRRLDDAGVVVSYSLFVDDAAAAEELAGVAADVSADDVDVAVEVAAANAGVADAFEAVSTSSVSVPAATTVDVSHAVGGACAANDDCDPGTSCCPSSVRRRGLRFAFTVDWGTCEVACASRRATAVEAPRRRKKARRRAADAPATATAHGFTLSAADLGRFRLVE